MKQLNWYQIFGKSNIPDGRTVLPTDDIQIWLHCANIWNKAYTTLAEVLADTDTLSALINSENAVDYMVRSTTWAASITVPKMTSNTTPSGTCYADSVQSGSQIYYAFDENDSTSWNSGRGPVGDYVGYIFTSAVCINSVKIKSHASDVLKKYKVQGSNDGVEYTDISPEITHVSNETKTFSNSDSYLYYRVISTEKNATDRLMLISVQFYSSSITADSTAMTLIGANNYAANTLLDDATWCEAIANSEYFESVLNVKVPTMTGYTTPSGEVIYTSTSGSDYPWRAFNEGIKSGKYVNSRSNGYIGYVFPSAQKIYVADLHIHPNYYHPYMRLESSEDGVTWNADTDYVSTPAGSNTRLITNEPSSLRYWRVYGKDTTSNYVYMSYMNFYGREDV